MLLLIAAALGNVERFDSEPDADRVERFDRVDSDLASPRESEEGFLTVEARLSTPGIRTYPDKSIPGGVRRELVDEAALSDPAALATLAHKPVTVDHPEVNGQRVLATPENIQRFDVGNVGAPRIAADGSIVAELCVKRADGIKALRKGVRGASLGYTCRYDSTPGTHPKYGAYHGRQHAHVYNHAAVVTRGEPRAGGTVVRMDSRSADDVFQPPGAPMNRYILAMLAAGFLVRTDSKLATDPITDDTKIEPAPDVKAKVGAVDKMTAELGCTTDELAGKVSAMRTDDDDTDAKRFDSFREWHTDRVSLEALAVEFKVKDVDKLDNGPLRKAICVASDPKVRTDATEDYYKAACDFLVKGRGDRQWSGFKIEGDGKNGQRTDARRGGRDGDDKDSKSKKNPFLANIERAAGERFGA